jgi:hypothetical protein
MFAGIDIIRIFALVIFEILIIGDFYYGRNIRKKELGLAATHVIRPKIKSCSANMVEAEKKKWKPHQAKGEVCAYARSTKSLHE